MRARLIRPDDLLNLQIEAVNMRLDGADGPEPGLVVDDPASDAFLVVTFPPQSIVEEAVFEGSPLVIPPDDDPRPEPTAKSPAAPDGVLRSRVSGESRLVFRVPPEHRLSYSIEGLLDWNELELQVAPLAAIGRAPSEDEIRDAPRIAAPNPLETSLELPYRLHLSPTSDVGWSHGMASRTRAGRTELWHTRLAHRRGGTLARLSRADPAPLRAIWSPDYDPADPPTMGLPDQDWAMPDGVLTAMTPSDRHEIVVLTSAFHGYVKGITDVPGSVDRSPFVPSPVAAEELILSPLGGWLKSRGQWSPPMPWWWKSIRFERFEERWALLTDAIHLAALDRPALGEPALGDDAPRADELIDFEEVIEIDDWGTFAPIDTFVEYGDSLNLSEWVHTATQGRDHYVRIVYEGFVYPLRHRAALIKVTERKVRAGSDGTPVAFLAQRMFVVIRQPVVEYAEDDERYRRQMPLRQIRLTTLITPDIDIPVPIAGKYSFWIKVGGQPFRFDAVGDDLVGRHVDFTTTLIFVPFSDFKTATPTNTTIAGVRAAHQQAIADRTCVVPGQPMTYADLDDEMPTDNTTLATHQLHFTTLDHGSGLSYYYRPVLLKAGVRLPAVEQLLGREAVTAIAYHEPYLVDGFGGDNQTGLFAHIANETVPGTVTAGKVRAPFAADQAGGLATPDLSISGLTRQLGPVAGDDLTALARNEFQPADFFKDVAATAKLFGTISLIDVVVSTPLDQGGPTVQITTEDVAGEPTKRRVIASLHWTPEVQAANAGIVQLNVTPATRFTVDGRVERIVDVAPAGAPSETSSSFTGELVDFDVDLLNVVAVNFESFRFTSNTGAKPDINIALKAEPVTFQGDLEFVNELKKFIPPGLFGDGASLDISATRVKAGFGIGLPAIAIGVFSLDGVTLVASVGLPFTNGTPLFDFGISSREHPFCLTVAFLGGGGFFHLQLDTSGMRMLEAALEFGAAASVNLGVASGGVHIMAGIYFAMGTKDGKEYSVLAGYLRMGGELSVLGLISISLEFVLSFGYENGKAAGRATLTVKVEIAFFSTSVEISVEKRFGGSNGDPRFLDVFDDPAVWDDYASAFA